MNPLSVWTYNRRNPKRAALLCGFIALVTAGLYIMGALVWGVYVEPMRRSMMALSKFSLVTPASTQEGADQDVLARLREHPDVDGVLRTSFIRIELPGMIPGEGVQFDLFGLASPDLPQVLERCGASLLAGRLVQAGSNEILLTKDVAAILDLRVGDVYEVVSSEIYANVEDPLEATPFRVVGILRSEVRLGLTSLEFLEGHNMYGAFPKRYLVLAKAGREDVVDAFLRDEIHGQGAEARTLQMLNAKIASEALPGFLLLLPLVLVVAVAFSAVVGAVNRISYGRRLPELGILSATGLHARWLIRRLTLETAVLAWVGWAAGIGLSWLVLLALKTVLFAPRGHHLDFLAWAPLGFALPVPLIMTALTYAGVRRVLRRLDPVAVVERGTLTLEAPSASERGRTTSALRSLAPTTFYRRHRGRAVLLVVPMSLTILGIVLIIFTLAVGADAQEPMLGYLSKVSLVRASGPIQGLDPEVVARIEAHPAVARVIPVAPRYHMLSARIPPFNSAEASPFGVYAGDMAYLVDLYGLRLEAGHLPRPGSSEMAISAALARNRDLEVGDVIGDPRNPAYPGASSLRAQFVVSGILAGPEDAPEESWWGFVSLEFLEGQGGYEVPDSPSLFLVPKSGQKDALDDWLEVELAGRDAMVLTRGQQLARLRQSTQQQMLAMAALESVIAAVAAVGMAVLNYILTAERMPEFGVLHALGHSRSRLVGRVLAEAGFTTGIAWVASAAVALAVMLFLRFGVFAPRGLSFSLLNVVPWLYTLPIPAGALAVTVGTTARTLSRLDPVAIVERRE